MYKNKVSYKISDIVVDILKNNLSYVNRTIGNYTITRDDTGDIIVKYYGSTIFVYDNGENVARFYLYGYSRSTSCAITKIKHKLMRYEFEENIPIEYIIHDTNGNIIENY